MTKAIAQTYTVAHEYRVQITTALMATCLVLLALYGINVYMVISHTMAVQSSEKSIATLGSTVARLDAQYLDLSKGITPATLQAHGFSQGQAESYIHRTTSIGQAHIAGNEL
ncbi:MAG: hypothetical protein WCG07_01325 [Candidatus Taylorbacteria bacterium]